MFDANIHSYGGYPLFVGQTANGSRVDVLRSLKRGTLVAPDEVGVRSLHQPHQQALFEHFRWKTTMIRLKLQSE